MSIDKKVIEEFEDRFNPLSFKATLKATGMKDNYVNRIAEIYEEGVYKNVMEEVQRYYGK